MFLIRFLAMPYYYNPKIHSLNVGFGGKIHALGAPFARRIIKISYKVLILKRHYE